MTRTISTLKGRIATHLRDEYDTFYADTAALISFLIGAGAFLAAATLNFFAGHLATASASAPVHDIILSNIPRIDTSIIHMGSAGFIGLNILIFSLFFPTRAAFLCKTQALLIVTRDAFINMTNLGIYPDAALPTGSLVTFGGDLFFSGHVAHMFLFALFFWDVLWVRYTFLALSVVLGGSALLGHYHYTIDVFAAPFMAYGVFGLSRALFGDDHRAYSRFFRA